VLRAFRGGGPASGRGAAADELRYAGLGATRRRLVHVLCAELGLGSVSRAAGDGGLVLFVTRERRRIAELREAGRLQGEPLLVSATLDRGLCVLSDGEAGDGIEVEVEKQELAADGGVVGEESTLISKRGANETRCGDVRVERKFPPQISSSSESWCSFHAWAWREGGVASDRFIHIFRATCCWGKSASSLAVESVVRRPRNRRFLLIA
jgi:hypothetical protein